MELLNQTAEIPVQFSLLSQLPICVRRQMRVSADLHSEPGSFEQVSVIVTVSKSHGVIQRDP